MKSAYENPDKNAWEGKINGGGGNLQNTQSRLLGMNSTTRDAVYNRKRNVY